MCQAKTSTSGEASSDAAHPLQADVGADAVEGWIPAHLAPEHGEVVLVLARLTVTTQGCHHPMIAQYTEEHGYEKIRYLDDSYRRIEVIGWMRRPSFEYARHRLSQIASAQSQLERARRAADASQPDQPLPDTNNIQGADDV